MCEVMASNNIKVVCRYVLLVPSLISLSVDANTFPSTFVLSLLLPLNLSHSPNNRFRPPNALELRETGGESIVQIDQDGTNVKLRSQEGMKGPDAAGFTFDRVFQMDTRQEEVFEYGVKGIVNGELNELLFLLPFATER